MESGEAECPKARHNHCNYCDFQAIDNETGWKESFVHIRDAHPEVWAADDDMRKFVERAYGIT